jgi:hypothetical protein
MHGFRKSEYIATCWQFSHRDQWNAISRRRDGPLEFTSLLRFWNRCIDCLLRKLSSIELSDPTPWEVKSMSASVILRRSD